MRANVMFALITRTTRGLPTEVPVGPDDGMPSISVVNADDILTAPKALLTERITALSPEKMGAVDAAVKFTLDLP